MTLCWFAVCRLCFGVVLGKHFFLIRRFSSDICRCFSVSSCIYLWLSSVSQQRVCKPSSLYSSFFAYLSLCLWSLLCLYVVGRLFLSLCLWTFLFIFVISCLSFGVVLCTFLYNRCSWLFGLVFAYPLVFFRLLALCLYAHLCVFVFGVVYVYLLECSSHTMLLCLLSVVWRCVFILTCIYLSFALCMYTFLCVLLSLNCLSFGVAFMYLALYICRLSLNDVFVDVVLSFRLFCGTVFECRSYWVVLNVVGCDESIIEYRDSDIVKMFGKQRIVSSVLTSKQSYFYKRKYSLSLDCQ